MHVVFVGPGRLARTLAPVLRAAGHAVDLIGRNTPLPTGGDLRWITVPDRAIAEVSAALPVGGPVAHASGATDLDALAPHPRRGSLHPLMTFPGPEHGPTTLRDVPAAIDGTDDAVLELLGDLARDLGLRAVRVPGDRRLYHAAAVMAGNLATVLLAEAGDVLAAAGVPAAQARAMLAPLAHASLDHAIADPDAALTGPVARHDLPVLDGHRAALRDAGLGGPAALYDAGIARAIARRAAKT